MGPGGGGPELKLQSSRGSSHLGTELLFKLLLNDIATLQKIQEIVKGKQKHLQFVFL